MKALSRSTIELSKNNTKWLISYGDTLTLLITFFIMMISLGSGEISKVHNWVYGQLSHAENQLNESVRKLSIQGLIVRQDTKGVHITISDYNMFASGEADPNKQLNSYIINIAKTIQKLDILHLKDNPQTKNYLKEFEKYGYNWNIEIKVEGHTDNVPIIAGSKFRNNWELSAARAQVVMRLLQKYSKLPENLFAVSGYSEYHPIRPNNSIKNRDMNRRIDVIINASLIQKEL